MKTQQDIARTVTVGDTIKVSSKIYNLFHSIFETSEEKLKELSEQRLDILAKGLFMANFNMITGEHRNITTNFRLPEQYRAVEVTNDHIRIALYPSFHKGYQEVINANTEAFISAVNSIELSYNDFYIMRSSI